MTDGRSPTLAAVVKRALDARVAGLHVAMPGRVVRVFPDKGLVNVKPLLRAVRTDEEGRRVLDSRPVIPNVPVIFPGSGSFRFTFPVNVDDQVLLVFADGALDRWLSTGKELDPEDLRTHDLTDAIAIPGLRWTGQPWAGLDAAGGVIGRDGGLSVHFREEHIGLGEEDPADAVAMAAKVRAEIQALRGTVEALVTMVSTTGLAVAGVLAKAAVPIAPPAAVGDVGSSTIKVKG
jgi:hypothetical protein